jgi:SAM-dependent methyltransferase
LPIPPPGQVRLGDLDRTEPLSRAFGGDRGTPLDRYYIDKVLGGWAADIQGCAMEIGETLYLDRFGRGRVNEAVVLDAPESGNPRATLIADLQTGEDVPSDAFDCIVLTQTLHMIYDVRGVLRTIHRALKPGGVCLATVPGIGSIDAQDGPDKWFWFMTQTAARRLFEERFRPADVTIQVHGNVLAATAFLHGMALEEVDTARLDETDPLYPVITGIRAVKAG